MKKALTALFLLCLAVALIRFCLPTVFEVPAPVDAAQIQRIELLTLSRPEGEDFCRVEDPDAVAAIVEAVNALKPSEPAEGEGAMQLLCLEFRGEDGSVLRLRGFSGNRVAFSGGFFAGEGPDGERLFFVEDLDALLRLCEAAYDPAA